MTVGERIQTWREAKGMTEKDLADRVGVTAPAVYQWERHGKHPGIKNLERAVSAFGITMERFYGRLPKKDRRAK